MTYARVEATGRGRYFVSGFWQSFFNNSNTESGSNTNSVSSTLFYVVGVGVGIDIDYMEGDFAYEDQEGQGFPRVYRFNERFDW